MWVCGGKVCWLMEVLASKVHVDLGSVGFGEIWWLMEVCGVSRCLLALKGRAHPPSPTPFLSHDANEAYVSLGGREGMDA